jgi:hypothetical protein
LLKKVVSREVASEAILSSSIGREYGLSLRCYF